MCGTLQDTESLMAVELTSIQEVVDSLCLLAADPCVLPASSQQVIDDYRHTQCKWFCQVCLSTRLTLYHAKAITVPHRVIRLVHWPLIGGLLHLVQRGGD